MAQGDGLDLSDLDGRAWVKLEGGTFGMGSESGRSDARPVHDVHISEFHMSRHPVTNAQYAGFVASGAAAPSHWANGEMPQGQADHPVTNVSWSDAQAFCRWLTEQMNQSEGGAHLPTEAQWEFAARGAEGREYPWGSDAPTPTHANFQESAIEDTTPVGQHAAGVTPAGVLDMAGNVRHWCLDWYAPYSEEAQQDPTGPSDGKDRTLRGGAYMDAAGTLRGSYRFNIDPESRFGFVGFRVVWSKHG